jgi:phosphatidylserine/phosphatidylglycerophosphate/cardiolipin synthase-like enzyme
MKFLIFFILPLIFLTYGIQNIPEVDARSPTEPCSYIKSNSYLKISNEPWTCQKVDYWVPERCGIYEGIYKTDVACQRSAPVASAPVASAPVASAPVASAPVASAPVASAPVAFTYDLLIPVFLIIVGIIAVFIYKKFQNQKLDPPIIKADGGNSDGGIPYSSMKCGDYFYKEIMFAKKSIYICSPWISPSYAQKFVELAKSGIRVKIITSNDKNNKETVELLNTHKNQSKFDFKIMPKVHTKKYFADSSLVADSTANFTKTGLWNQHNTITIYKNSQDYKKHESMFFDLWKENNSA